MSDRPNFLFIITDQHRADHLGCYGNPIVRTPHIDGIAARGARWNRFYVANPICMPNRASIMTGRMPSLHGAPSVLLSDLHQPGRIQPVSRSP